MNRQYLKEILESKKKLDEIMDKSTVTITEGGKLTYSDGAFRVHGGVSMKMSLRLADKLYPADKI